MVGHLENLIVQFDADTDVEIPDRKIKVLSKCVKKLNFHVDVQARV